MIIQDKEFGEIIVRKNSFARYAKFSISTSGRLQMSVPKYASEFLIKRFINSSREQIRRELPLKDPATQRARDTKKKLLMKQAKEYLKLHYRPQIQWLQKPDHCLPILRASSTDQF